MKTTRLLLATLSLAALAACGTESLTSPSPENARQQAAPSTGGSSIQSTGACAQVVVTTDVSGNLVETCATNERGPGMGSGS